MTTEEAIIEITLFLNDIELPNTTKLGQAMEMAIKALEQESRWIPVSERLPNGLMVKTLVSCEDSNGLPVSTVVAIYNGFDKQWDCEDKVIAWMPLPKPYESQESEK